MRMSIGYVPPRSNREQVRLRRPRQRSTAVAVLLELAHEAAAQLLLDLEAEQPAGTGPRRPDSDLAATYETVSERWGSGSG